MSGFGRFLRYARTSRSTDFTPQSENESFDTDPFTYSHSQYTGQISNTFGARGFGSTFPNPARDPNATTVFVTNLNESGAGSLQAAMQSANAANPKVIIPLVSGVIEHATTSGAILVRSTNNGTDPGYIWFAGQAGPGKLAIHEVNGIDSIPLTIRESQNVIIENLTIRTREMTSGTTGGKDPLTLLDVSNIMINRCSFTWGVDSCIDVWGSCDYITIQDSIIMECLRNAGHTKGQHDRNLLIGPGVKNVSLLRNGMGNAGQRQPEARMDALDYRHTLIVNGGFNAQLFTDFNASSAADIPDLNLVGLGYVYTGVDTERYLFRLADNSSTNVGEPQTYMTGNKQYGGTRDGLTDWDITQLQTGARADYEVVSPHDFPRPDEDWTADEVKAQFGSGYNPGNNKGGFDAIDQRMHEDLKGNNTTPRYDDIASAGGFPTITSTSQTEANWRASFDTWKSNHNSLSTLDLTTAADNDVIPETGRAVIEQYILESF